MGALDRSLCAITEAKCNPACVVPPWRGPVSWMMMRLSVRYSTSFVAFAALAACAGICAHAQVTASPTTGNGTYVPGDPLAGVRYDNKFDVSLGAAYAHIKAGPPPLHEGANLGGLDATASYWFSRRWAVEGTGRAYVGTSGAGLGPGNESPNLVKGPFVAQYMFAAGPEWLGPHNKHASLSAHALVGGSHFDSHPGSLPPSAVYFFNNQTALAAIIGGHIDLNRSPRWVFRITPDALYTRYGINYGNQATYAYWNFGISAGVEYKFKRKR